MGFYKASDNDPEYVKEQIDGHDRIAERKDGCFYCAYFKGCHTAVWRSGQTCDLFQIDKKKIK